MLRYKNNTFNMTDLEGVSHKVMQVTSSKAKKAYESGKPIWLHPCNMRVNNAWQKPMPTSKKRIEDNAFTDRCTFENVVNDFRYYNCDNERGRYPIFFVPTA